MDRYHRQILDLFRRDENVDYLANTLLGMYSRQGVVHEDVYRFIHGNMPKLINNFLYDQERQFMYSRPIGTPDVDEYIDNLNDQFIIDRKLFIDNYILGGRKRPDETYAIREHAYYSPEEMAQKQNTGGSGYTIIQQDRDYIGFNSNGDMAGQDAINKPRSTDDILQSWQNRSSRGTIMRDDVNGGDGAIANLSLLQDNIPEYDISDKPYYTDGYNIDYNDETIKSLINNDYAIGTYSDQNDSQHVDRLFAHQKTMCLNQPQINREGQQVDRMWFGGQTNNGKVTSSFGDDERLLSRRIFRYGNAIPPQERHLVKRNYDYNADEVLSGNERSNIAYRHDMTSLWCRLDRENCNNRNSNSRYPQRRYRNGDFNFVFAK